jgi:hypothetical protein
MNPRPAEWPQADIILGNPPFLGNKRMRDELGDGEVETLRSVCPSFLESADFVMVWWHKAAEVVRAGRCRRVGFSTTSSLRQSTNCRVPEAHLAGALLADGRSSAPSRAAASTAPTPILALRFASPDHPWVERADGPAVRIARSVGARRGSGILPLNPKTLRRDAAATLTALAAGKSPRRPRSWRAVSAVRRHRGSEFALLRGAALVSRAAPGVPPGTMRMARAGHPSRHATRGRSPGPGFPALGAASPALSSRLICSCNGAHPRSPALSAVDFRPIPP